LLSKVTGAVVENLQALAVTRCLWVRMQGKGPTVQPALNRVPNPEDLQKLLKAIQMGTPQVQQPFGLDNGRKFVLKVQQPRAASGLGKTRSPNSNPLWSLHEGVNTFWEYNTADIELIYNLSEEAVYAAPSAGAPVGGTPAAALAVLEELAMSQAGSVGAQLAATMDPYGAPQDSSSGFGGNSFSSNPGPSFASQEPPQFSSENQSFASGQFNQPAPAPPVPTAASPQAQNQQHTRGGGGVQFSGNLTEQGVLELFKSIGAAKMIGRLDLTSGLESIEVYFEDGAPRRASFRSDSMTGPVRDITGEEVLLEAMTWRTGFFQFNPSMKSAERSPMRRLDILISEGAALKDYFAALDKAGLSPDSVPVRTSKLSEAEFEKALTEGIPVNMQQQKQMYMAFDGKTCLGDIVRQSNLPKSAWLPLIFNLLQCGTIGLSTKTAAPTTQQDAPQSPLIKEAVQEAFQELLRPDTGLISYPLFMHFMEVEFQRALRLRQPFSLIIVSVHKEGNGITEQLSSDDLKLVSEKIRTYLEPYDHVGHYQTLDIGILLPHRPSVQAREYIDKIVNDFNRELAQAGNQVQFVWSVGVGCIPEDGIKVSGMVSKAENERNAAKENRQLTQAR